MPPQDASARLPWRSHWPAAILAVLAGVVAVWAHVRLFPALSWNRDEPVYLWHVELLRDGRLTAPDGGHPDAFLPWLSAARDGHMFTQYTLGWPLTLLAADVLTGTPAAALPVGAALAVVGVYALTIELLADRTTAVIAAALLVASPLLAIQGGVYLSYLFTLGLGLIAGALILSGVRRAQRWRLLAAGVLLGWVLLTRPYDAVLWGAAFAVHVLIAHRARWRQVLVRLTVVALAAMPFVVATLAYNAHVTGRPLGFPITTADPLDTFGFGERRLMPGFPTEEYTPLVAVEATAKNAVLLPWFLAGGYLTLVVAGAGLWRHRREPAALAAVLISAAFALGYLPFWGTYLSSLAARISGPIYFVPLFAPICILAAVALRELHTSHRRAAILAGGLLVVATLPGAISRFDVNRDISLAQAPWRDSVDHLDGPALVLVADTSTYLLYSNPFAANDADLAGDTIFATATSPQLLRLVAAHPERSLYLQEPSVAPQEAGPREDPYPLRVLLTPAEVRVGTRLALLLATRPPPDVERVALTITTGAESLTVTRAATDGDPLSAPLGSGGLDLSPEGAIVVTVGYGDTDDEARAHPRLRNVVRYRVVGDRMEVLLPASAQVLTHLSDHDEWRHALRSNELVVDVSEAARR